MRPEDRVRIRPMVEAADDAAGFIAGKGRPDLDEPHAAVRADPMHRDHRRSGPSEGTANRIGDVTGRRVTLVPFADRAVHERAERPSGRFILGKLAHSPAIRHGFETSPAQNVHSLEFTPVSPPGIPLRAHPSREGGLPAPEMYRCQHNTDRTAATAADFLK